MPNFFKLLKSIFNFHEKKKQLLQLILIAFLVSFGVVRVYSVWVGKSIFFHGFQIHHFYFGMLILSVGGVIALLSDDRRVTQFASILVGIGIGLFADEIGLLLNCTTLTRQCTYAFPDSMDIIGTITLVFILILITVDFIERRRLKILAEAKRPDSEPLIESGKLVEPETVELKE